ncbi:AraC family transcriptional regulator [Bacillus subtilis subsp. subtilis]|nr:AraC family transcriptional regulator [Bacillus subtilis subsp. subtilis]
MDDVQSMNWVDRGRTLSLEPNELGAGTCIGVSRMSSVQLPGGAFTVWMQLRGSTWLHAREGRFLLRRGGWIVLDRDSRPRLQADRHGVCIGVALCGPALDLLDDDDCRLYPGRGQVPLAELQIAVRLWRQLGAYLEHPAVAHPAALQPLLRHVAHLQQALGVQEQRCPGRSVYRKRHVLGRLCRAHLLLQGNVDRVVRVAELAELSNLSYWYFSKAFLGLFGENPQAAGARLRLEHAGDLLARSDLIIGEVGAACGFESGCSFARAFRAHFGVSASAYRAHALRTKANSAQAQRISRTGWVTTKQ